MIRTGFVKMQSVGEGVYIKAENGFIVFHRKISLKQYILLGLTVLVSLFWGEFSFKVLALLGLVVVPFLPFVYKVWTIDYKTGLYSTYRSIVGFTTHATDTQFLAGKSPVIEFSQDNNPPEPTGSFTLILKDAKGDIDLFDVEYLSTINKIKQSLADYNVTIMVTT